MSQRRLNNPPWAKGWSWLVGRCPWLANGVWRQSGGRVAQTGWKNYLHSHTVLQSQSRNILKWSSIVFPLTYQKTYIMNVHLRSSTECTKVWFTKSSTREVNAETIIGTSLWHKILPLNGFNLIRVNKTFMRRQIRFLQFLDSSQAPKVVYTDNSMEFVKACEVLTWNHCTSTLHRTEINDIAERVVRRVKESTSAVSLQSGLVERWWADSMECYCCLRSVQDLLADGKTSFETIWRTIQKANNAF